MDCIFSIPSQITSINRQNIANDPTGVILITVILGIQRNKYMANQTNNHSCKFS